MNSLIDIIIIYICSTLYILVNHLTTQSIICMLITLILGCLAYYFSNKYVSLITVGLFVLCTLLSPVYFFYLPLFLYLFKYLHPNAALQLLFTHKLDTCCQAMCQEHKTAKNPTFRRRRIINRLNSVTASTVGVNSNPLQSYITELIFIFLFVIVYIKYEFTSDYLSLNGYFFIICFCILACILVRKTNQIISLKESNHQISDIHSYMKQSLQLNQKKQRMEQDREIHLATLAERNRIAREIHDNVGHMLSRSILQLGAILTINKNETLDEPLSNLKDTLNTAMNSIRESVHDLRDESLDLELMILNMTKEFPNLDIKLDYDMSNHASKDVKYCFLAILKEAMTNTIKHSNGNAMEITIREHPALYQLLVQDNGTSNSSQTNDINSNHGMGLDNMRERVTALGGTIHITSDNGFRIFIIIQKPR